MADSKKPKVVVLSGPNGAGKSTAPGLSAFAPERAAFRAGRVMLGRLRELSKARQSFAFETTLATRSYATWLNSLRASGYHFELLFLWLPNPEVAIARVEGRVKAGGHNIPEEVIRRRYYAGLRNLAELYLPLADYWKVVDNTRAAQQVVIAEGKASSVQSVYDSEAWQSIPPIR